MSDYQKFLNQSRMCLYSWFTTFCQHGLNWNKSECNVIKLCYFPFAVAIILSRFCLCQVLPYFIMSETKGPHHIHSLRSSCFIKKSAFNDAGNFVMVVKFTFQSVFSNSRRNPRDFSARGSKESLELYSILWSDWPTSTQNVLRHGNCFATRVRRRYFPEEEKWRPEMRLLSQAKWSPVCSVIIPVINKIWRLCNGSLICLITSITTSRRFKCVFQKWA